MANEGIPDAFLAAGYVGLEVFNATDLYNMNYREEVRITSRGTWTVEISFRHPSDDKRFSVKVTGIENRDWMTTNDEIDSAIYDLRRAVSYKMRDAGVYPRVDRYV